MSSLSTFHYRPVCSLVTRQCRKTGPNALRHQLIICRSSNPRSTDHRCPFHRSTTSINRLEESCRGLKSSGECIFGNTTRCQQHSTWLQELTQHLTGLHLVRPSKSEARFVIRSVTDVMHIVNRALQSSRTALPEHKGVPRY